MRAGPGGGPGRRRPRLLLVRALPAGARAAGRRRPRCGARYPRAAAAPTTASTRSAAAASSCWPAGDRRRAPWRRTSPPTRAARRGRWPRRACRRRPGPPWSPRWWSRGWLATPVRSFSEPQRAHGLGPASGMEYRFELEATAATDGDPIRLDERRRLRRRPPRLVRLRPRRRAARARRVIARADGRHRRRAEVLPAPLRFRGMPAARFWAVRGGRRRTSAASRPAPRTWPASPSPATPSSTAATGILVPLRVPAGHAHRDHARCGGRRLRRAPPTVPAAAVVDGGGDDRPFRFFELTGDPQPRGAAGAAAVPAALAWRPPTPAGRSRTCASCATRWPTWPGPSSTASSRVGGPSRRPRRAGGPAPRRRSRGRDDAGGWCCRPRFPTTGCRWCRCASGTSRRRGRRHIMLQRGRMPGAAGPGPTRGARGQILDAAAPPAAPRGGDPPRGRPRRPRFQSARDPAGRLHTWVGRRKGPGRGEGDSGLAFDVLERTADRGR